MADRPADSEGSADAEHMRAVSQYLSRLANKYPDRWHPDISYLRAGANYVGVLAGRAASPVAESALREALVRLSDYDPYTGIALPREGKYLGCRYCAKPYDEPHASLCAWQQARDVLAAADREEPTDDPA